MINAFFSKKRYFTFLIVFIIVAGIAVGYFVMNTIYDVALNYTQQQRLTDVIYHVNKSSIAFKEFLLNSYTDESFYKTGKNKNTIDFDSSYIKAMQQMELFLNTNDLALASQDVDSLKNGLINYQNIFKNATALYKVKGFKDAGLEGSMRTAVHQLEHASFLPDLKPLLSLRRHEKDFILRKDLSYVHKYDKEWQQLMDSYSSLTRLNAIQKDSLIQALASYRSSFQKIVLIEQRIGLTENVGLRSQIAHNQYRLEVKLLSIQSEIAQQTEASIRTLKAVIWIISSFLLFFLILLTALFAVFNDHVRKPVLKLKEAANQVSQGRLSIDISDLKNIPCWKNSLPVSNKSFRSLRKLLPW